MSNKNRKLTNTGIYSREGYEASVGLRTIERAGACPQAKGVVHEIMFCDKYNSNPMNFLKGNHAQLTKSTTAKMKDVIMTNHGKVVGHAQLKDTISNSGVRKTVDQITGGHYGKTAVYGTKETTKKVAERLSGKTGQTIKSSGISSNTTSRIANKALGRMPTASAIGCAARAGGTAGAAIGAGIEVVSSLSDVLDGEKDLGDAAIDVAAAGIKGGVSGAASAAAGSVAAGAVGAGTAALAGTAAGTAIAGTAVGAAAIAAAPVVIGFGAACAVGSLISDLFDDIF